MSLQVPSRPKYIQRKTLPPPSIWKYGRDLPQKGVLSLANPTTITKPFSITHQSNVTYLHNTTNKNQTVVGSVGWSASAKSEVIALGSEVAQPWTTTHSSAGDLSFRFSTPSHKLEWRPEVGDDPRVKYELRTKHEGEDRLVATMYWDVGTERPSSGAPFAIKLTMRLQREQPLGILPELDQPMLLSAAHAHVAITGHIMGWERAPVEDHQPHAGSKSADTPGNGAPRAQHKGKAKSQRTSNAPPESG